MKTEPRIAFIIDSLPSLGGGEKVLFTALELYPQADIFTLIYNAPVFVNTPIAQRCIKTSWLNTLPLAHTHHRLFLPLMPSAIERFDLHSYDFVVCFSYAVAHGVLNHNGARHVSYTYTPMRYAWTDLNLNGTHTRKNLILDGFMRAFRKWDRRAAARVHSFASISQTVSKRIADAYQRAAPIIYPPVEVDRFTPLCPREDYYMTIARLVPHKRVDLIVQAFSKLNLPLLVVGDGPELPHLQQMATSNIHFLGYVSDDRIAELLGKAHAFVSAAEEDFGIAIVEAQAAGCPVIVYGKGGALETVTPGVTGLHFEEQTVESLTQVVQEFERIQPSFHEDDLVRNAQRYRKERFLSEFQKFVMGGL
jgi:glycosyltransferase involved in cell wall biosynthesis